MEASGPEFTPRRRRWILAAAVLALALGSTGLLWRGLREASAPVRQSPPVPPLAPPRPMAPRPADSRPGACRPAPLATRLVGARLVGLGSRSVVTATLLPPEAGGKHAIYLGQRPLGKAKGNASLLPVELGAFARGSELEFSIRVQGSAITYRSGPGERNHDGRAHAAVMALSDYWLLGFEDLEAAASPDFDDATVMIRGEVAAELDGVLWCLARKRPGR